MRINFNPRPEVIFLLSWFLYIMPSILQLKQKYNASLICDMCGVWPLLVVCIFCTCIRINIFIVCTDIDSVVKPVTVLFASVPTAVAHCHNLQSLVIACY